MAKIAIIGGGIEGLAAECYARMNGLESVILEKAGQPGGLCTSWNKGDYVLMAVCAILRGLSQELHFTICGRTLERCLRMYFPEELVKAIDKEDNESTVFCDLEKL
ncbi:NAD(P)-binding protein [Mesotoga sp.]|uniref:NAD(P)-binding protein n=1 Tax=Mesotoga sp. TaxID=2053577 RepID=UPI00345EE7E7